MNMANRNNDAERLQQLVQDLEGRPDAAALVREHLESARACLLGSMPQEYEFNLKLVNDLVPDLDDESLRTRVADFIRSQRIQS
jgi:hypothetical protein